MYTFAKSFVVGKIFEMLKWSIYFIKNALKQYCEISHNTKQFFIWI